MSGQGEYLCTYITHVYFYNAYYMALDCAGAPAYEERLENSYIFPSTPVIPPISSCDNLDGYSHKIGPYGTQPTCRKETMYNSKEDCTGDWNWNTFETTEYNCY